MDNKTTQKRRETNKPKIKRLLANKCERERVRKINEAFEILKTHIPYCDSGRIRTKLDVLKFAIDYIQILTKMVSQNEAEATLLQTAQLEKKSASMLATRASENDSPRPVNEMFPAHFEGASAFPFDDQLEMTSPTLTDEEVFFEPNVNIENPADQHYVWSDHQFTTHQAQTHHHSELAQHARLRSSSFEEQSQDSLFFWPYQGNDITKASLPLNRQTTIPSDSNNSELAGWLHSFLG